MKITNNLVLLALIAPFLGYAKTDSGVFGVTLLPGQTFQETIETHKQFKTMASALSPELEDWIVLSTAYEDQKSKHKGHGVEITISIPEDAIPGEYLGVIYFDNKSTKPDKTLQIAIEVAESVISLPADPGNHKDVTVAGIDSDGDGVRDDVQRYIYFEYIGQPALQLALMDVARSLQSAIVGAEFREESYQALKSFDSAYNCLDWIDRDSTYELVSRLQAEQLNTRDRTRTYDEFNRSTVGSVIMNNKPSEKYHQDCSFDVFQYQE